MKLRLLFGLSLAGFIAGGCAHHHAARPQPTPVPTPVTSVPQPMVTPDNLLAAKVVRYNPVGRFVVLSFPVGQMPQPGQTFFIYRTGMKIGQIKITGPQRDNDTVADLIEGDAQEGDDVHEQ
jgi:hypothetical protein